MGLRSPREARTGERQGRAGRVRDGPGLQGHGGGEMGPSLQSGGNGRGQAVTVRGCGVRKMVWWERTPPGRGGG